MAIDLVETMTIRFRSSRLFFASLCLALGCSVFAPAQTGPSPPVPREGSTSLPASKPPLSRASANTLFEAAAHNYNNGKFWDARTILEDLLRLAPDFYLAHSLYWDVMERTVDTLAKRAAVRDSLAKLESVPDERRTEEYFYVVIRGCDVLGDRGLVKSYTDTAIKKFPRGRTAQIKILAEVRAEPNNEKALATYDALIADFEDDPQFRFELASDKFGRLASKRTFYDAATMTATGSQLDRLAQAATERSGNRSLYLSILRWLSDALSYTAASESMRYAQKGFEQYQALPDATRPASRNIYLQLFPPLLRSANALQNWATARDAGARLMHELEIGPAPPPEFDEAAARQEYAVTLEKLKNYDAARDQLSAAVVATKDRTTYQTELRNFNTRHPLAQMDQVRFDRALSTKLSNADRVHDDALKNEILKSAINRAAPSFHLTDLSGKPVSSDDYRGKVLVLGFWATWCGPCIREMEEMKVAYQNHADDPKVAFAVINLDTDKTNVPQQAREKGYNFPILLSDGKVEGAYGTNRIPKLIIIDPQGNIRFDHTGYTSDGTYLKKLDWMIEAARK